MTSQQNLFLLLKLALIGIFVVGVFILAGMGKIDSTAAVAAITGGVGALVVALGIQGSGISQANARILAAGGTPPSGAGPKLASIPPVAKSVPPLAVLAIGLYLAVSQCACQNPIKDASIGLQLASCMWGVYQVDEAKSPAPAWTVVAVDMGTTCGADVADIIGLFGATSSVGQAAVLSAATVHTASMSFHGKGG